MSYYVSRAFGYVKTSIGSIGLISSAGMIIYGALAQGAWVYLASGSIFAALSLFTLFDSSKVVADIRNEIRRLNGSIEEFREENNVLKNTNNELQINVNELNKVKDEFVKENNVLKCNISTTSSQLEVLDKLQKEYKEANDLLFENLKTEEDHLTAISNLETNLKHLIDIKDKYVIENQKMQEMIEQGHKHIESLEKLKEQYISENNKLSDELSKLETNNGQLNEQVEYLNDQVTKLHSLYQDSKKLLLNLANAGDVFNQFSATIDTNMVKMEESQDTLDNTATVLHSLVDKLSDQTFDKLDANQDGMITQEEFIEQLHTL